MLSLGTSQQGVCLQQSITCSLTCVYCMNHSCIMDFYDKRVIVNREPDLHPDFVVKCPQFL